MATLRQLLTSAGFNWDTGAIIWQRTSAKSPGWSSKHDVMKPERIDNGHFILDQEFDTGYGGPEMPRFVAKDHRSIFFPCQYDGATWVEWVCISLQRYIDEEDSMPYPGG